ncbi:putative Holliday junction resolvase [Bacillus niacini]|jgi:putative holliday junction resolvase|uniref:Putative pre-16S rRNA nuclease n=2 Tax=Neobacillus TaxID=2675232 RepID=A0A852T8J5_9BACI|nr:MULTISPECIES: Holliday junction resolvase RuvX [Neobacillus]MDP5193133.1 Holliday junction resolvase RuvX [Neobacillus sp. 179.-C4.2 HS]MDQ0975741.1 putative Holliday junction resolvase [Neobacillus niacini]MEC1522873.1 Holliday junction resolvase RuvX [Neobacillus niacini]NYE05142.1 putative Holliday junction resolvase [Neobacillus niacini]
MRIMGLDVGSKTVGIAISDELGWTAQGLKTLKIDEEKNKFGFDEIGQLIKEYGISQVVIGLPKNMNGTIGPRGEASKRYAEEIENQFSVSTILWDERLTTMAAERVLLEADVSRKKRKKVIDKMAASMILQGYLDSKN